MNVRPFISQLKGRIYALPSEFHMNDSNNWELASSLDLPNAQQTAALTHLIEECAEVIQAATKVMRFGWSNAHPNTKLGRLNNLGELNKELRDVRAAQQKLHHVARFIEYVDNEVY